MTRQKGSVPTGAWQAMSARCQTRAIPGEHHEVCCPYCGNVFDLFAAKWCEHFDREPSKVCPHCQSCLCNHPAYGEPLFWKEAPKAFRAKGFSKLFLFYL
jgi:hypothetical protein